MIVFLQEISHQSVFNVVSSNRHCRNTQFQNNNQLSEIIRTAVFQKNIQWNRYVRLMHMGYLCLATKLK